MMKSPIGGRNQRKGNQSPLISSKIAIAAVDETIVALSSPPGYGARAIVRLSGSQALAAVRFVASEIFPDPIARRQIWSCHLALPEVASPLPADVFYYRAPNTYTGQDLVEIHTLSAMPLVDDLLASLLRSGARAALPGEFTMRGFLAGKLDLTRAEAVHAVIDATGPEQLKSALGQLAGGIARPMSLLRDDLLNLLADIEAGLDFVEEDIQFVARPELLSRVTAALAQVTLIDKQLVSRSSTSSAFRVALAGPPNAGKSSLFNALLGRSAALVSPIAGTTRDFLEADLEIEDVTIRLCDTAGLADATDSIDAAAQALGRDALSRADLVVVCAEPGGAEYSLPPHSRSMVSVTTKSDLLKERSEELSVSATTGAGVADLRSRLATFARDRKADPLAESLSRCRHHVQACLDHLRRGHRLVLDEDPAELLAIELRLALDELGAIVGAVYTDDLLDRVFSRFCIGK
jgi:tRNA modification GTPase